LCDNPSVIEVRMGSVSEIVGHRCVCVLNTCPQADRLKGDPKHSTLLIKGYHGVRCQSVSSSLHNPDPFIKDALLNITATAASRHSDWDELIKCYILMSA
jgi:hypothetical protein